MWGLIVDGGDNTFNFDDYTAFSYTTDGTATSLEGGATDDVLYTELTNLTSTTPGGSGTITTFSSLTINEAVGAKFALIWFDSVNDASGFTAGTAVAGDYYGTIESNEFVVPADNQAIIYTGFSNSIQDKASYTFDTIPEPSSITLLGLGSVALLLRRRR